MRSQIIRVSKKRIKNNTICTTIFFGCKILNIDKIYKVCNLLNISSFKLQLFNVSPLKQQALLRQLKDTYIVDIQNIKSKYDLYIDFKTYDMGVFNILSRFEFDEFNLVDLQYYKQLSGEIMDSETINKVWLNYNLKEYGLVTIDIFMPIQNSITELITNIKQVVNER